MKIIFVHGHDRASAWVLNGWRKLGAGLCLFGLPMVLGVLGGFWFGSAGSDASPFAPRQATESWRLRIQEQQDQVAQLRDTADRQMAAVVAKMADMQARLWRLDALGQRLAEDARLGKEFDFRAAPPMGGTQHPIPVGVEARALPADVDSAIAGLEAQIRRGETRLDALDHVLMSREVSADMLVAGAPIRDGDGYMTSLFGVRADPFHGSASYHTGVDFAGKVGTEIVAVASGVVAWSGNHKDYGNMVEISHGHGITTRYAHNRDNLVVVGDIIQKGQVVAHMGDTGRSTGPHVHFEVLRNGQATNPSPYLTRASR